MTKKTGRMARVIRVDVRWTDQFTAEPGFQLLADEPHKRS